MGAMREVERAGFTGNPARCRPLIRAQAEFILKHIVNLVTDDGAKEAEDNHALVIDNERTRLVGDRVLIFALIVIIQRQRECDAVLVLERPHFIRGIRRSRQTKHCKAAVLIRFVGFLEFGHLADAGAAPRPPEVNQHRLPAQLREAQAQPALKENDADGEGHEGKQPVALQGLRVEQAEHRPGEEADEEQEQNRGKPKAPPRESRPALRRCCRGC